MLKESFGSLVDKFNTWLDALITHIPNILLSIFVLVAAIFVSRYLKRIAKRVLSKTTSNQTVVLVMANLVVAVFMVVILFIILSILQLSNALTALLGTAGVAGLAIGLALQDPLVNLFSGVLMSMRGYYRVGDLVETNDYFGKIERISLRSTIIATPQGQRVIIPNKDVIQNPLTNYSVSGVRRVDLKGGVSYGDDLPRVRETVLETVGRHSELMQDKPVEFYFTEYGDSSINFVVRFWILETNQSAYLDAQSEAIIAIKKAFDDNGITIPFPIRTLDFGIVGGERLDTMYPPGHLLKAISKTPSEDE